jgi:hypothetical protein
LAAQDWGGELTFPLPATSSTPRTWLQDQEEVWLAGNTPLPARPPVPLSSPLFQPGSYKAGLIFLYTDKKENKIVLIHKEIQMGSGAKSYMRKGFLRYEEMRK